MKITDANYGDFFRANTAMMRFTERHILALAEDNWREDFIDFDETFDTIFDEYGLDNGSYDVPRDGARHGFGVTAEQAEALKEYCSTGLEEMIDEWRNESRTTSPCLTAAQRNGQL